MIGCSWSNTKVIDALNSNLNHISMSSKDITLFHKNDRLVIQINIITLTGYLIDTKIRELSIKEKSDSFIVLIYWDGQTLAYNYTLTYMCNLL